MDLREVFHPEAVVLDLLSTDRDHSILELVRILEERGHVASEHRDEVLLALLKREKTESTGIGQGVAIPHIKTDFVDQMRGAIGISKEGLDFGSPDGKKAHLIFLFLAPTWAVQDHLRLLALLGHLIRNPDFVDRLTGATREEEVRHLISKAESFLQT